MKSVGIIGGLGPETTAEFYLKVIFGCQEENQEVRPLIVTSSVPLPLDVEKEFIDSGKGVEQYLPFLTAEAKRLEASGVDFLVMPCNSLHVFIDELRTAVSIPVLSIVEETVKHLVSEGVSKVGLISTSATAKNRLYDEKLSQAGITVTLPDGLQSAKINEVIQRLVSGKHLNKDRELINEVIESLVEKDVQAVSLACTDLQILLPHSEKVEIFDTMEILADATTRRILS